MRRLFSCLLAGVLLMGCAAALGHHQAQAQPRLVLLAPQNDGDPLPFRLRAAKPEERKAAINSIETQLKAFRDDDYTKAAKYQSKGLQENFDSPDQFRQMMKQHYPQFANYKSAKFGEARCTENGLFIQVPITLVGKDGVTVKATYVMIKEDGEYRVSGVYMAPRPKVQSKDIV